MNRIITYELNGGDIPSDFKLVTVWNMLSRRALPSPTRGEDIFLGWYTVKGDERKEIVALNPEDVYNGMVIEALWEETPKPTKNKRKGANVEENTGETEVEVVEDEKESEEEFFEFL